MSAAPRLWLCGFVALLCSTSHAANIRFVRVTAGVGGVVKVGGRAELRVIIEQNSPESLQGRLVISCLGGFGDALSSTERDVDLPSRSRKEYNLPVLIESGAFAVEAALWQGNRRLARQTVEPTFASRENGAVLTIGEELLEIERFTQGLTLSHGRLMRWQPESQWSRLGIIPNWSELPTMRAGYDGLNSIIVTAPPPAQWSETQRRAFTHWLRDGGTLIVCAGDSPAAWRASFLEPWLPVEIGNDNSLCELGSLRALAHTTVARRDARVAQQLVAASKLRKEAKLLAGDERRPLVVKGKALQRGTVVWIAFDPRREPFRHWVGRDECWRSLLRWCNNTPFPLFAGIHSGMLTPLLRQLGVAAHPTRRQFLRPLFIFAGFMVCVSIYLVRYARRKDAVWLTSLVAGAIFAGGYAVSLGRTLLQQTTFTGMTTRFLPPDERVEYHSADAALFLPSKRTLEFGARADSNAEAQDISLTFSRLMFDTERALGINYRFDADAARMRVTRAPSWSLVGVGAHREAPRIGFIAATVRQDGERFHYHLVNRTPLVLRDARVVVFLPDGKWSRSVPTLSAGQAADVKLTPSTVDTANNPETLAKQLERRSRRDDEPLARKLLAMSLTSYGLALSQTRGGDGAAFVAFTDRTPFPLEAPGMRGQWRHLVVAPLPGVHPRMAEQRRKRGDVGWQRDSLQNAEIITLRAKYELDRNEAVKLYRGDAVLEFTLNRDGKKPRLNVQLSATPTGSARVEGAVYNWRADEWIPWQPLQDGKAGHDFPLDCIHPQQGAVHVRLAVRADDAKSHLVMNAMKLRQR